MELTQNTLNLIGLGAVALFAAWLVVTAFEWMSRTLLDVLSGWY